MVDICHGDPMTPPMTPREKVELKPCPFCGRRDAMQFSKFELHDGFHVVCEGDKNCPLYCSTPYRAHDTQKEAAEVWNRRTALASGSGDHADHSGGVTDMVDHAELARLAERCTHGDPWYKEGDLCGRQTFEQFLPQDRAFIAAANPATVLALLAENAALRGERDQIAGESIWWKGVIGDGPYRPSGEVRSIKHLHPAMVKPIYEANKGTAVADVIAGLIFLLAINQNREQFLVADANERRTEAERKLAEAVGLLRRATEALSWAWPKALMAMDDHRLLRMKAGHDDIVGQYRSGTRYVGIYQSEVDEIESNGDTLKEARSFLSKEAPDA